MATKTKITIPKPCQENWLEMTPLEQGRFCQLCQKNVFDFTTASDREILEAYNKDQQLCGRFTTSQLNRDLHIRKEKSSIWVAATSAIVSFIGLGTNEVQSQETIKVEQTDKKVLTDSLTKEKNIFGIVTGVNQEPLEKINVRVSGTNKETLTNDKGWYSIVAKNNDLLIFSKIDCEDYHTRIKEKVYQYNVSFDITPIIREQKQLGGICIGEKIEERKRTLFGRLFHSIGNWFR